MGAGDRDLLVLQQSDRAPRVRGTTGLYHFAILVPSRADLARALRRLVETETVLQGAADHLVAKRSTWPTRTATASKSTATARAPTGRS